VRRCIPIAVAALALVWPRLAAAHVSSLTHSEVTVDGAEVSWQIRIARGDLAESLGRDPADAPSLDDLRAGAAQVIGYVTDRIEVLDGEVACPPDLSSADLAPASDGDAVLITWTARCPAPVTSLVLDYDLFFELDPTHEAVVQVTAGGEAAPAHILREEEARFVWDLAGEPPSGILGFIRSGIDHILFGFDHIAFVLTLLLVLSLSRQPDGWRRRRLPDALRATALIVTGFTVAHSLTLIAASLGWVDLPGQLVESAIALSIAYTAIENVIRPDGARWRLGLTFAFGLLHGLGFARMLEVLLPPDDVILPLLAFNVGVELGQLAIVAIALPATWLLCGAIGAERYRRVAMPALSAILAVLGLLWLAERVLEVTILGL
jgi:hypothetical protein